MVEPAQFPGNRHRPLAAQWHPRVKYPAQPFRLPLPHLTGKEGCPGFFHNLIHPATEQGGSMAVSGVFALSYGCFRIIAEFVRVPDAQLGYLAFGWLTMGQLLSLPMVIAGIALVVFAYRRQAAQGAV